MSRISALLMAFSVGRRRPSKAGTSARRRTRRRLARICALKPGVGPTLNLFFPPSTLLQGDKLPVYAGLSRTITIVAALLLTAVPTTPPAREFRAADTQSEDYPTVQ